ncbi:MAG: hypothetical protein A2096_03475 [Spirochaetes bacterium GWF1_41_5]|nr:MAG: hypothetical protein A2096_03475 [Spirochaetes bacterium GWF1_41_5]
MKKYSKTEVLIANIPYAVMILIGTIIILAGFPFSFWQLGGAAFYTVYGILGSFWIMIFVCPYCAYYNTDGCPCGYGIISARFVKKGEKNCFSEKFQRHIPVIVMLWIIPAAAGIYSLISAWSWSVFIFTAAFVINSYIVLPLVSRKHSCSDCPQKDECPWMRKKHI